MGKLVVFAVGTIAYAAFVVSFLWGMAFLGNFGIPLTIDAAPRIAPLPAAAVDLSILAVFAVQHSIMARAWFKQWWTAIVPAQVERSVYVLAAASILMALFVIWQPIGGMLWNVAGAARLPIVALYWCGWVIVVAATFQISHFDFLGLKQVWSYWTSTAYQEAGLKTPWMYALVRHPMMFGTVLVFWASPMMTVGHLIFAGAATAYIFVGMTLEERDMVAAFGEQYADYRQRTPMLIPSLKRRR